MVVVMGSKGEPKVSDIKFSAVLFVGSSPHDTVHYTPFLALHRLSILDDLSVCRTVILQYDHRYVQVAINGSISDSNQEDSVDLELHRRGVEQLFHHD
jgi:hypothetical protein